MKFFDFFSGIGGFRIGMENAGHECVGFCEFDKYAYMSYVSMHCLTETQREYLATLPIKQRQKEIMKDEYRNGEWYCNDIRNVHGNEMPRADVWCGGFPCQSISVAGKKRGLSDLDKSGLFFQIIRILKETGEEAKPRWLFLENVKNLISINGGWDFATILAELDSVGYDVEWQCINSKDYVPQNRERIFIIGHLRGTGGSEVFPIKGTDGKNRVDIIAHRKDFRRNLQTYSPNGITETLDTAQGGGRGHYIGINYIGKVRDHSKYGKDNQNCIIHSDSIVGALKAQQYKEPPRIAIPANGVVPVLTPDRTNKRQNERQFKDPGDQAFTLTAIDRHGIAMEIEGYKEQENHVGLFVNMPGGTTAYSIWYPKENCFVVIRKLTPKECFRLQGFSDEYFEKAAFMNSDSQLWKQAGNSVTVPVIQAIGERIR